MADSLSRALGQEIGFWPVEADVFRSFGFPGADDAGNMFQFKRDFDDVYRGRRDLELSRSLNPELQTFDEWLQTQADQIPIPE